MSGVRYKFDSPIKEREQSVVVTQDFPAGAISDAWDANFSIAWLEHCMYHHLDFNTSWR